MLDADRRLAVTAPWRQTWSGLAPVGDGGAQREAGRWWVTVAAQYADASVRYFAVPVAADDDGGSFTVTGAPGVVAAPGRAEVAKSSYGVTVAKGELSSTVGQSFGAYLAGSRGATTRRLAGSDIYRGARIRPGMTC
jgi:hypothetical protein